eukprot:scaffold93832_cov47-Attheya_sp.AAC.2
MCALNCPAWSLQDSLVAPVESADDEYTAMIHGLVHLAGCFHPTTNAYKGAPHPKMMDRNIRHWMRSMSDFPEEEEQALLSMVAISAHHTRGMSVWSQEFVATEIARLGLTEKIRAQADAAIAQLDAREFLSRK